MRRLRFLRYFTVTLAMLGWMAAAPLRAQEATPEEGPSAEASADVQPSHATLATARTIFVEPMSEGFDKFLSAELGRSKNLYKVTSERDQADLWMKGVVTVIEMGHQESPRREGADLAHSSQPVNAMATVVVVPRDKNVVLWQGDEQLQSVPGNHIPGMAKKLVENFRKIVKRARKSSKNSPKDH